MSDPIDNGAIILRLAKPTQYLENMYRPLNVSRLTRTRRLSKMVSMMTRPRRIAKV